MSRTSSFLLPGSYLITLLLPACSSPTESATQTAGSKTATSTAAIPTTKPAALIDQKNGFEPIISVTPWARSPKT